MENIELQILVIFIISAILAGIMPEPGRDL